MTPPPEEGGDAESAICRPCNSSCTDTAFTLRSGQALRGWVPPAKVSEAPGRSNLMTWTAAYSRTSACTGSGFGGGMGSVSDTLIPHDLPNLGMRNRHPGPAFGRGG